jgi:hypothetical protein
MEGKEGNERGGSTDHTHAAERSTGGTGGGAGRGWESAARVEPPLQQLQPQQQPAQRTVPHRPGTFSIFASFAYFLRVMS